ncbi:FprA family A-type flavoprotein [Acetanaerobacterium elongatum]|uniref:Flavorubredoxin n=1 Tax=Acetanaerobacterium elongatum TaxID=258515 RepID=A0A1G9ZIU3_9FIRM|nr:FprA family A-type flavoprotein [Acetanaerobacterium elongatum]SDN21007.1 Flavorubredoxin [Acetanaerobacterium elongatum]
MSSLKITDGIYSVGVLNPSMRVFDIVMATEYGTSYNSYIVKGAEKTALIETCHLTFFDAYLENIKEVCSLDEIDYIVLNHNEPDHSGSLRKLTDLMPKAQVVASQAGAIYLKNITNKPQLQYKIVKDGETIDLGGKTLQFINAPFLHWPDSMFTWVKESKTLFSCDFLGTHYCEPLMLDSKITYQSLYEEAFKNYYDAIFSPFKPYVLKGIEKMEHLGAEFVCTSHGPVLTAQGSLAANIEKYRLWSTPTLHEYKRIPIFYCTAYGNTEQLAKAMREGILEVIPDAVVNMYNIIENDMHMLQAQLNDADAFLIGSPTINRDAVPPIWALLSHYDAISNTKKPCTAFGSFGWSGEAVPMIKTRLEGLKLSFFGEGYRINFVPSEAELTAAKAYAIEFAKTL